MDLRQNTLAVVQWGSYRSFPVGGISTFVESIIPHLSEQFELKLIGMSLGETIGRWTTIDVAGRSYDFLPVVTANQSKIVPDRMRLAYAVAKYRDSIFASGSDVYYVHMTEAAIPLVVWSKRPVVIHVHGLYNLFKFSRHCLGPIFANAYDKWYPLLFSKCVKVLGAGTQAEFDAFSRTMRVPSGAAIPTCVREKVFYPRDRAKARRHLGIRPDETVLLFVGRMTHTKNPLLLLEAGHRLQGEIPNLRIVFVGDGPLRARVEEEATSLRNVTVNGMLLPEQTALWMNAADALTVVSKTEAFTSIVALEALSCGLPVVATPVSALPEIIQLGVNGAVSHGFAPDEYAAAVRKVLSAPPNTESCVTSVRNYSSAAVGARVAEEIREILGDDLVMAASSD